MPTVHEAKTHLSKFIEQAERGEEVIISRGKTEVLRLVPVKKGPGKRTPGLLKNSVSLPDAFYFDPLPEAELEAWE